jgi:Golgi nucleoside diphosphatase
MRRSKLEKLEMSDKSSGKYSNWLSAESKFKVGDRIVCVYIEDDGEYLVLNKVYVVAEIFALSNIICIKVEGIDEYFFVRRFISLKEYRRRKLNKLERIENE